MTETRMTPAERIRRHDLARIDPVAASDRLRAAVTTGGTSADDAHEVASALHAVFPNLRFAWIDIDELDEPDGSGGRVWLIPVPRTVALIVSEGADFGWSTETDSGLNASVWIEAAS